MKTVARRFFKALAVLAGHQDGPGQGLRGHVDAISRQGARGWALDPARPGHRPLVEAVLDGRVIASARADLPRPDLAEQGLGDGANGFRLDFPPGLLAGGPQGVTVRLAESGHVLFPRQARGRARRSPVVGAFEALSDDLIVSGWAASPGRPDHVCRITVSLDGTPVASAPADIFRPDLAAVGARAFRLAIPARVLGRPVHEVAVLADGHPLDRSPKKLELARCARPRLDPPKDGRLRVHLPRLSGPVAGAVMRINGEPAGEIPRTETDVDWPLPAVCLAGRPRVYQAEVSVAGLTIAGEPRLFAAPGYDVAVRRADCAGISARVVRTDATAAPRIAVLCGEDCLGWGLACDRGPDRACLVELAFDPPLPGERVRLVLRDADAGLDVAAVDVMRRHQALCDLARLARAGGDGQAPPPALALLEAPALSEPDATIFAVSRPLPPAPADPDTVAVVIPIHGGRQETADCLESVLAARNEVKSRVILVEDGSPDPGLRADLDALAARDIPGWSLLRLPVNRGFPRAANLGLALAGGCDAVLLNADTVVFDGWLDRLRAAALRDPRIGTVTPFSNNGEICTLPEICTNAPVADQALGRAVAVAAARCNDGRDCDLPVGVGFCLYLKRACLDELGLFDEAIWGKGYGEETDFCLRAAARGWRNVLAADCFVIHRGSVSFGAAKAARIRDSAQKILQRHPFYDDHIRRFIRDDPARLLRQNVALGLLAAALPRPRLLHVSHAYGGGSERYLRELAAGQRAAGQAVLVLRGDDTGASCLSIPVGDDRLVGLFAAPHVVRYPWPGGEALHAALRFLDIEAMHLHAPFGLPVSLLRWLTATFPYEITVHDYAWLCPRVTLTGGDDRYCGEPDPDGCRACLAANGAHPGLARTLAAAGGIEAYRDLFRTVFAGAGTVFTGSEDVAERLARHGFTAAFTVRPHPESAPARTKPFSRPDDGPVRVALFGGLSRIKGADVLAACARVAARDRLPLHFTLFGYPAADTPLDDLDNVSLTGRYREEDLDDLVASRRPDLAFFPFQWPETFSYTLSHAFRLGLWPVVPDIGAPAERVRRAGVGTVYPMDASPEDLCALLLAEAARLRAGED